MGLMSCKKEKGYSPRSNTKLNEIVVISLNAPSEYVHLVEQDSIGKEIRDTTGPRAIFNENGFTYLDYMTNVQRWLPKPGVADTIVIECYSDYLELATNNFFTATKETFLVKRGDTLVFTYQNGIPKGRISNRKINDIELNYNAYRLRELFNNKYTSHHMIFGNLFLTGDLSHERLNTIDYYEIAKEDYRREIQHLDSLYQTGIISEVGYKYRKDALHMLMENHKRIKPVAQWVQSKSTLKTSEQIEKPFGFDLSKTDSLMTFSFFRDYLKNVSQYGLEFIQESNGNSGAFYIDSRIRFDSIIKDKRFNQTAKNYLLFETFNGIGQNYQVTDKEKYFKKLQEYTTNTSKLNQLQREYNLDFTKSDKLILTTLDKETLTFSEVLKINNGKWLYVDFWASWCKPCIELMPESKRLRDELKSENVEFVFISLNDNNSNWKKASNSLGILIHQNYFTLNGNVSMVIENLGITSIPHYLIYDPEGNLVNGYAKRPGQGAREQLIELINDTQ